MAPSYRLEAKLSNRLGGEDEKDASKDGNQGIGRVQRPRERAQGDTTKSGKGMSPGVENVEQRNDFQTPTEDGTELADGQH